MIPLSTRTLRRRPWQHAIAGVGLFCALASAQKIAPPAPASTSAAPSADASSITDRRIHFFQAKVERDPTNFSSFNSLAAAFALKSRETGDVSYLELAESALQKSLQLESTHTEAVGAFTQLAGVHLSEHRFKDAAVDADRAIALGDGDLGAYPYAGDAQLELGNYEAAQKIYTRLADPADGRPHPGLAFLAASHGSGLHWIMGQDKAAFDDMSRAATLAEQLNLPAENLAWTRFMLGEQSFQAGDLAAAEKYELASLAAFPRYHRALAELGRIRAAQHRPEESVAFYKQALAIIPLPVYAAALGDVYTAQGKPAEAEKQYALVEFIARLTALSQQVFNRELALFYADHDRKLPEAVALARRELEVRHDIYTSDALAWALFKSGDTRAALAPIAEALRFHTSDALLEFHAGMIYARLGDKPAARAHLARALALNPNFHVLYARTATLQLKSLSGPGPAPAAISQR